MLGPHLFRKRCKECHCGQTELGLLINTFHREEFPGGSKEVGPSAGVLAAAAVESLAKKATFFQIVSTKDFVGFEDTGSHVRNTSPQILGQY